MSSAEQPEHSRRINDQNDGSQKSVKDGAIELCFQLLSSGRRLDEVLSELAANSSMRDDRHSEPEVVADPKIGHLPAADARPLVAPTAAEFARSAADGVCRRPNPNELAPAGRDNAIGGGYGFLGDGQFAAAGVVAARRRAVARRVGALLVCGSVVALIASAGYGPPPTHHDRPATQPRAVAAGQPAAAGGGANDATRAVTAARSSPPPRPPIATALISPPVEPGPARSASAVRPVAPVTLTTVVSTIGAVSINSKTSPSLAGILPVRPAMLRDAASTGRTNPAALSIADGGVEVLVTRGDALLATGDVASARRLYRRGADAGNGTAALRLGETFDPVFLTQAGLSQVPGDVKIAAYWYRRARDLGVHRADLLLQSIAPAKRQ